MAVLSKPVSLRSRPIESAVRNINELKCFANIFVDVNAGELRGL